MSAISISLFSVRCFPEGFQFSNSGMAIYSDHTKLLHLIGFLNSILSQTYLGLFNEGDIAKLPILESAEDVVCNKVLDIVDISKSEWDSFEVSLIMCALLFLMIWAAANFYPWDRLLEFFPKDIEKKAKLHKPPFPAAPAIGWIRRFFSKDQKQNQ